MEKASSWVDWQYCLRGHADLIEARIWTWLTSFIQKLHRLRYLRIGWNRHLLASVGFYLWQEGAKELSNGVLRCWGICELNLEVRHPGLRGR